MEAIILAGGMGTRLKTVITDIPKPMAPIHGEPFLSYLLNYLSNQHITKVILSTGYMHEVVENYYGRKYGNLMIDYSIELEPLGTGGAIKKALTKVSTDNVFVLNGDTFFKVDLKSLLNIHLSTNSDLTLALKPLNKVSRYGTVSVDGFKVTNFEEKKKRKCGNINGGIYLLNKNLFSNFKLPERFSFEEFMEKNIENLNLYAHVFEASYFVDIGVPEDYLKAQSELSFYE